jgi:peptide/nickel transport system substrate-binding protein
MRCLVCCAILTVVLIGEGCAPSASSGPAGETLIYSRGEDANTLDPIHTDIGETVKVLVNVYDTLVAFDDTRVELVPALAQSWQVSDDGRVWTFALRSNVTFHDGTPCNAAAVKFSLERLVWGKENVYDSAVPYRPSFQNIERIETPHDLAVVIHLRTPSAVFLANMAMFPASIVSPTAVRRWQKEYGEHPVGTGPFQLANWKRDQQLVLTAFEKHWRGPPGVKQIAFLPIHDAATRVQQLRRGEAHIADDIPAAELDALASVPDVQIAEQREAMNVAYLSINVEKPPLDREDVRRAIAMAIDKARFVALQYRGHAQVAKSLVPPIMWGHHTELADTPFAPDEARRLLAKAAEEGGFTLPLELTLHTMGQARPYLPEPTTAAAFIKDALAAIDIRVVIEQQDVNQHFPYLMAGKHQLGLAGWTSDNNDPDNFLYPLLDADNVGEHGNNLSRYRNQQVHTLLTAAQHELDRPKRLAMYLEAQEIIAREVPLVPLAHVYQRVAMRKQVQGYTPHATGLVRLRGARLEAMP